MKKDLINGVVSTAFAVLVYVASAGFAKGGASLSANPALYPRILAAVLFGLGAALLVKALFVPPAHREAGRSQAAGPGETVRVWLTMGLLAAYVGAIYLFGFLLPTVAFMIAAPLLLGTRLKTALLVAIPATAVLYAVFFVFFKVPIPYGILFQ